MKKCKFCAEDIQDDAVKCKYCKSDLVDNQVIKNNFENMSRHLKTFTFEVSSSGNMKMARKLLEMEKEGWKEINRTTQTGKYKGGKGCCLFIIFFPLAFLAGHKKDKVIITMEKYVSKE